MKRTTISDKELWNAIIESQEGRLRLKRDDKEAAVRAECKVCSVCKEFIETPEGRRASSTCDVCPPLGLPVLNTCSFMKYKHLHGETPPKECARELFRILQKEEIE